MSQRTTPSSDEFWDDLDFDQLTWENELAREQARQQRRRQAGLQRDLSERLEGHTTPLSVGVGQSPLVTPTGVQDALQRAMDLSGIPTAPPGRGRRRAQCVVSEFGRAQRDDHPGRGPGLAVAHV